MTRPGEAGRSRPIEPDFLPPKLLRSPRSELADRDAISKPQIEFADATVSLDLIFQAFGRFLSNSKYGTYAAAKLGREIANSHEMTPIVSDIMSYQVLLPDQFSGSLPKIDADKQVRVVCPSKRPWSCGERCFRILTLQAWT
ncbi:MAG: hypothetical protein AAGJ28_01615 [Pseudomonadota bacterium]